MHGWHPARSGRYPNATVTNNANKKPRAYVARGGMLSVDSVTHERVADAEHIEGQHANDAGGD